MRTIENDIPEVFIELAREGLALGFAEVSIGFWYRGGDFVSPIEWAIWLNKRDSRSKARESIVATMSRGEDTLSAYVSSTGNALGASYWGPEEIRSWMQEPLEAENDYTHAWSPVTDALTQEKLLSQFPLFVDGVRSGWSMKRKVSWTDKLSLQTNGTVDSSELPTMTLSWEITNSFYSTDVQSDPQAPISTQGWSSIILGEERFYQPMIDEHSYVWLDSLTKEEVEKTLRVNHPWFVRVAYNDEENEKWLHFPEARMAADDTVDSTKF